MWEDLYQEQEHNMALIIPTQDLAAYNFQVTLDNVVYTLKFDYNERNDHWSFSISTADNDPIIEGIKLVFNVNLIEQYQDDQHCSF